MKNTKNLKGGRMTFGEKVGYSFTDFGGNILFVTLSTLIMYFYTDIMHLPASGAWSAATVILISRIVNALLAFVWGGIIDHKWKFYSKWGQCRPWFLFLAGPFVVTTWLCFFAPALGITSTMGMFWYAVLTYILSSGVCYNGLAAALNAIVTNLTKNDEDRRVASTFRMFGGGAGWLCAAVTTFVLTAINSAAFVKDSPNGYYVTVGIWAVMALILLICAFILIREREFDYSQMKSVSVADAFRAYKGNWTWGVLVLAFIMMWAGCSTRDGVVLYYAQYVLSQDLTAAAGGTLKEFEVVQNAANLMKAMLVPAAIITPFVAKAFKKMKCKSDKSATVIFGMAVGLVTQALCMLCEKQTLGAGRYGMFFTFWILTELTTNITMSMMYGMIVDTVDFGEYHTGIKAAGMLSVTAAQVSNMIGGCFGAYVPLEIMNAAGYGEYVGHTMSAEAIKAISFSFNILPGIFYAANIIVMIFYAKFIEPKQEKIRQELAERRAHPVIVNNLNKNKVRVRR